MYDQRIKVWFPVGEKHFFAFQYVCAGAWPHSVSNGASSVGLQQSRCESDHLPPSNDELRMLGAVPLLLHTPVWCAQGQLYQTEGKEFYLSVAYRSRFYAPACQNTYLPEHSAWWSQEDKRQCPMYVTVYKHIFITKLVWL